MLLNTKEWVENCADHSRRWKLWPWRPETTTALGEWCCRHPSFTEFEARGGTLPCNSRSPSLYPPKRHIQTQLSGPPWAQWASVIPGAHAPFSSLGKHNTLLYMFFGVYGPGYWDLWLNIAETQNRDGLSRIHFSVIRNGTDRNINKAFRCESLSGNIVRDHDRKFSSVWKDKVRLLKMIIGGLFSLWDNFPSEALNWIHSRYGWSNGTDAICLIYMPLPVYNWTFPPTAWPTDLFLLHYLLIHILYVFSIAGPWLRSNFTRKSVGCYYCFNLIIISIFI